VGRRRAEDEIDALQAAERFEEDLAVADSQVVSLHERVAKVAGEVGVARK